MEKRYERYKGESEFDYGLRLIGIKLEEKPDDLDWEDLVDMLNLDIHRDTLRKSVTGSPYSGYAVWQHFKNEANTIASNNNKEELAEIKKATIQMRDERNELNRKFRELSRAEKVIEIFKEYITKNVVCKWQAKEVPRIHSDNDVVVLLSDIHYGIDINNSHNMYNPIICKERLENYLAEIRNIAEIHKSENCYLVLGGDLISGDIRTKIRLENIENVVDQIKNVSILIENFIEQLSSLFFRVHVFETPGNHSRLFPNKDENQKGELLDKLVPHYLKAALQNLHNVFIHDNEVNDEICAFSVRGRTVAGIHGDKDTINTAPLNMRNLLGYTPDIVIMAHKHYNASLTVDKTKIIQNGSLCGMDNYTIDKRLTGVPEQTVFVLSDKTKTIPLYHIQFN